MAKLKQMAKIKLEKRDKFPIEIALNHKGMLIITNKTTYKENKINRI